MAKINGQNIVKYSATSADGVIRLIMNAWETVFSDCKIAALSIVESYGLYYAYVVFEEMKLPTIDPVKHGKWEFGKSHEEFVEAECTACGGMLLVKWYDKLSEYNYCPRCGADMRGE